MALHRDLYNRISDGGGVEGGGVLMEQHPPPPVQIGLRASNIFRMARVRVPLVLSVGI